MSSSSSQPFRLYTHALQSVLQFLTLAEINDAALVNREWMAAAIACPSIHGSWAVILVPLKRFCSFPLAKHVRHILNAGHHKFVQFNPDALALATKKLPQLQSIRCCLALKAVSSSMAFPAQLHTLDIRLSSQSIDAINAAMVSISSIPVLRVLTLRLPSEEGSISFAPLVACAPLRDLALHWLGYNAVFLPEHIADLRRLTQLASFCASLSAEECAALVADPCALHLKCLTHPSSPSPAFLERLASHPWTSSLTQLDLESIAWFLPFSAAIPRLRALRTMSVSFAAGIYSTALPIQQLHCLAQLTSLTLKDAPLGGFHWLPKLCLLSHLDITFEPNQWDGASSLEGMLQCPALTKLRLKECNRDHEWMRSFVDYFPNLSDVELDSWPKLQSLDFCTPVLAQNLEEMKMRSCPQIIHAGPSPLRLLLDLQPLMGADGNLLHAPVQGGKSVRIVRACLNPRSADFPSLHLLEYHL